MKRLHLAFAFIPLCLMAMTPSQPLQWYKGNTHTHTINSDGDSTPDEVVRWYRERDYHFLVLSDHNFLTEVEGLNSLFAAREQFLIINGEEVTDNFGESRIHVNGLNLREVVPPQGGSNAVDTLQRNVDAIRSVGGVPHINHPNFRWSLTADQMRQVRNNKLFEIYNGSPSVNNHGGGGSPGLEAMWDNILSSGKLIYGIAVDDAHHFKGEFSPDRLNPGRGWVVVRAPRLSAAAIMEGLEAGRFYASTGVSLSDLQVDDQGIEIAIQQEPTFKYTTHFIGDGGRLLSKAHGLKARYRFQGGERYVRARVVDSMGYHGLDSAGIGGLIARKTNRAHPGWSRPASRRRQAAYRGSLPEAGRPADHRRRPRSRSGRLAVAKQV